MVLADDNFATIRLVDGKYALQPGRHPPGGRQVRARGRADGGCTEGARREARRGRQGAAAGRRRRHLRRLRALGAGAPAAGGPRVHARPQVDVHDLRLQRRRRRRFARQVSGPRQVSSRARQVAGARLQSRTFDPSRSFSDLLRPSLAFSQAGRAKSPARGKSPAGRAKSPARGKKAATGGGSGANALYVKGAPEKVREAPRPPPDSRLIPFQMPSLTFSRLRPRRCSIGARTRASRTARRCR